ncbi:uncharacterized protein LOC133530423 [Cydia pomonella]|uniref:uncharacterized protein LOC133530423 n=1 Tax=Cydia pomonella TaxID=82600 RepID=UPI002ADE572E|nr:uncharacterized protein LOC133530423 [Cydia pomonella]
MSNQFIKNKREINNSFRTEYLMNNILDQDFQAMLFPLNFAQSCLLMPSFSIINNFITPDHHMSFYIKSIIGCTFVTLSHVFRFLYYYETTKTFSTELVTFLLYFDFIFFSLMSFITYIVNLFQRSYVVDLIIKSQHVLDRIKTDKRDFFYILKIQNWLSVLFVVSFYIFHWFSACFDFSILSLLAGFYLTVPLMIFDIQVVHVTRYVVMIKNELIDWIHKMEEYKTILDKPEEEVNYAVSESDMFNAYTDILKAFSLSNKVYQFLVSLSLFMVPYLKWRLKKRALEKPLKILQCFVCVNFPDMRKTCKNVLRLNRATLCKMSAFGVFEFDAAFPLRLLGVLVTYTVVLLQFAFLSS